MIFFFSDHCTHAMHTSPTTTVAEQWIESQVTFVQYEKILITELTIHELTILKMNYGGKVSIKYI